MTKSLTLSNGINVSVIQPESNCRKFMLYFHGGGFVYGSKNDLPNALIQIFLEAGYNILAVDYPLAPNHSLRKILAINVQTFDELKDLLIQESPFSFCGRSAGGYAILSLTQHLLQKNARLPERLVSFYGYYNLEFLTNRSNDLPLPIHEEQIQNINQTLPVYDDPLLQRSLLYFYGIQQKKLPEFYQIKNNDFKNFAIEPHTLKQFPRTFCTASTTDKEVPFKYSKSLKRLLADCKFLPVYDLEHDFLKQPENDQVKDILRQLQIWLRKEQ